MSKFLRSTFLFLLPIVIVGITEEILLRNIPNDYILKREYLEEHAKDIEVLVLGNSSTYRAINPDYLTPKAYNLAYVSQTIDYDFALFDKYSDQLVNLKYVILPISYSSLCINLENSIEPWREKNYRIYYKIDDYKDFTQYSEVLSNKQLSNIKRIVDYYLLKKQPELSNTNGWGLRNEVVTNHVLAFTGKKIAKINRCEDYSLEELNISILQKMIKECEETNIKLILLTTPSYKTFYNEIDNNQLQRTRNHALKLANESPNCFYYDFLKDKSFKAEHYFDAAHLNESGAKKFTSKIDSLISTI